MKRLIPATIVFILLLSLTIYSHFTIDNYCKITSEELKQFSDNTISSKTLTQNWQKRKEKMSAFVNHGFLDEITLYMGQIELGDNVEDENFTVAYKNIETLLSMIRDEQRLSAHSFY